MNNNQALPMFICDKECLIKNWDEDATIWLVARKEEVESALIYNRKDYYNVEQLFDDLKDYIENRDYDVYGLTFVIDY